MLPRCGPGPFARWAALLVQELAGIAAARPLLSGTYRVLRAAVQLAEQGDLLGSGADDGGDDGNGSSGAVGAGTSSVLRLALADVLQEVLAACRRYKVCAWVVCGWARQLLSVARPGN
jgi:hypothetical protein